MGTHGLQGAVRGLILTDFPEDLARLEEVILEGATRRTVKLRDAQVHGRVLLFQFEGIDTVEAAEALRGSWVKIPRSQAHPLPPEHYYVSDIVGIEAFTQAGRSLGTIRNVFRTGANDVYTTERVHIPATREAVLELDVPGRRMVVNEDLIVED